MRFTKKTALMFCCIAMVASSCARPMPERSPRPVEAAQRGGVALVSRNYSALRDPLSGRVYPSLPTSIVARDGTFLMAPPPSLRMRHVVWVVDTLGAIAKTLVVPGMANDSSALPVLLAANRGGGILAVDRESGCVHELTPDDVWTTRVCLSGLYQTTADIVRFGDGSFLTVEERETPSEIGFPFQVYDASGRWVGARSIGDALTDPRRRIANRRRVASTGSPDEAAVFMNSKPSVSIVGPGLAVHRTIELSLPEFVQGPGTDTLPSRGLPLWSTILELVSLGGDSAAVLYTVPREHWREEGGWQMVRQSDGMLLDTPSRLDRLYEGRIAVVRLVSGQVTDVVEVPALPAHLSEHGWILAARQQPPPEWRLDFWRWHRKR